MITEGRPAPTLLGALYAATLLIAIPAAGLLLASLGLGWLITRLSRFDHFQGTVLCLIALAATAGHLLRTLREMPAPIYCNGHEDDDLPLDDDAESAAAAGGLRMAGSDETHRRRDVN